MSSGSHVRGDPWLIQVLTPIAVLVTASVGVRIFLRSTRRVGFWLDDWLILASLVFAWGMYTISILTVLLGGVGTPYSVNRATDPTMAWMGHNSKLLYAGQMVYASAIMTAKLSILAFYWRLFPTPLMKRGCVVLAVLTGMWWTAGVLVDIFQCTPVSRAFDASGHTAPAAGSCISQATYCLGMIVPNILIDVMMLCLPTLEVSRLHLPRAQRCAVGGVFLLGAGVTAASGVRLYYHLRLVETHARDNGAFDPTMALLKPQLWMTIEPDMAIICACLPVMRPLVTMLLTSPLYRSVASYMTAAGSSSSSSAGRNTKQGASGATGVPWADPGSSAARHPSAYAMSSFDSLEYLRDEDLEAGRLAREARAWPPLGGDPGGIGCQTQVSTSRGMGSFEVPQGVISVTTVVDCHETVGGSLARGSAGPV